MATIFFEERVAFADASFQLFSIIAKNDFAIQAGRFGAVVTQVFPLMAVKVGLSLKLVMLSYSLAFVILPFILFLALFFLIKNKKMAMVLALFTILLTNETFYWVQSELLQGCVLVLFLFGWIAQTKKLTNRHLVIFYLLTTLVIFVHPLSFIPFSFLWLYFFLQGKKNVQWRYGSLMGFALVLIMLKHILLPNADYDTISMGLAKKSYQFWYFFRFKSTRNFLGYCVTDYYLFPILLIWITYHYYRCRKKWQLGLFLSFTFGYLQLVNGTFAWGSHQFHLESFYQILSIFLLIPLIYEVLPHWRKRYQTGSVVLIGIIVFFRIIHIYSQHTPYTERKNWFKDAMEYTWQFPENKFVINEKNVPIDTVINGWAAAYETLLLSALQHPDSTRTLFVHNDEVDVESLMAEQKAFLTPFGPIPYAALPKRYFHFQDTSRYHRLLMIK